MPVVRRTPRRATVQGPLDAAPGALVAPDAWRPPPAPPPAPALLYVITNTTRVVAFELDKLRTVPRNYFAQLAARLRPIDDGATHAHPLRVPLPEWFVAAFADWTLPMAPREVFLPPARRHAEVWHYLDAISWNVADAADVPVYGYRRGMSAEERAMYAALAKIDEAALFQGEKIATARPLTIVRDVLFHSPDAPLGGLPFTFHVSMCLKPELLNSLVELVDRRRGTQPHWSLTSERAYWRFIVHKATRYVNGASCTDICVYLSQYAITAYA